MPSPTWTWLGAHRESAFGGTPEYFPQSFVFNADPLNSSPNVSRHPGSDFGIANPYGLTGLESALPSIAVAHEARTGIAVSTAATPRPSNARRPVRDVGPRRNDMT
jgi:hypothetical protein